MKNIVLIGMPACGKSTVGVILAKALGADFLDTDIVLQKRENDTLQNIIENKGIDEFIRLEEKAILSICCEKSVVATGGSAVYSERSMEYLKKGGTIVYLSLGFDEIKARINNIKSRGVVKSEDQTLLDIYNIRTPLYEKYADIKVDCRDKTVEQIVDNIIDLFCK